MRFCKFILILARPNCKTRCLSKTEPIINFKPLMNVHNSYNTAAEHIINSAYK